MLYLIEVMHGNEQSFSSKYKLCLPTEEELKSENEVQKTMFYLQRQEKTINNDKQAGDANVFIRRITKQI